MAKLTFVLEDGQSVVVPVEQRVSLGREEGNDIVVDDQRISARHAELVRGAEGVFEVRDLDSKAGTFVNGERVERSRPVADGDKLAFGPLNAVFDLEDPVTVASGGAESGEVAVKEKMVGGLTGNTSRRKRGAKEARSDAQPGVAPRSSRRKKGEPVAIGKAADAVAGFDPAKNEDSPEVLFARLDAGLRSGIEKLEKDKLRLQGEVDALQKALRDWRDRAAKAQEAAQSEQDRLDDARKALGIANAGIQSAAAREERLQAQLREAADELSVKGARLEKLRAEEVSGESRLGVLRQQVAALEERSRELETLADSRRDQVKTAEKRLEQADLERVRIEAVVGQMSGAEERLQAVRALCAELESKNSSMSAALAELSGGKSRAEEELGDLKASIAVLRDEHRQVSGATGEAHEAQARVGETLNRIQAEREAHEKDLATKRQQLIAEMMRLDEARAKRAELEAQRGTLVGGRARLDETEAALAALVARRDGIEAEVRDLEARRDNLKGAAGHVVKEREAAAGRVEALGGSGVAPREERKDFAAAEREQRERFEEMRRLTNEAEKEFAALKEELARSIEVSRRELADIEMKLSPLRDWKEAMDQRYARLAALPEDSVEARELWREIETEKGKLKSLITPQPGQTRGVSLNELVLRGIAANVEKKAPVPKGVLHAPSALTEDADTPEQRANVGATGTGALYSGTGQEMALKARLSRLRESVQRETMRLDFLRQERAREESRAKSGPGSDAMMREHDRHLESKVRREEEHLATLRRKLELGEAEEEKRREKIAELEHKIAELRSDITDAERQRSDLRHQADLVQTELRNYEAALDRVKKMAE